MIDCLFCKIIAKEIPSTPVYEDDDIYAFLDIRPVNAGHTLVVPKIHCNGLLDCDPAVLPKWILTTQKIALAMQRGLKLEGFNLEENDGRVAGQLIQHLHMHIVPRRADDGLKHWPGKAYATTEEAETVAKTIRSVL